MSATINSLPKPRPRPILAIEFDGVIHSGNEGMHDGAIYNPPVEGFWEWADEARKHFRLIVFSWRSDSHKNVKPMMDWMSVNLWDYKLDHPDSDLDIRDFEFITHKPQAFLTIDSRALRFTGDWKKEEMQPTNMKKFKPWNVK